MPHFRFRRFLAAASTLLMAACASDPIGAGGPPAELTALPRPLTASEEKVLGASNAFTFALFRQLASAQPGGNVFASPLSASMALGMTLNGAAGATFEQMRAALQSQGLTQEEINEGYHSLIALLRGLDPATDMRIANSVWVRLGTTLEPTFVQATQRWFGAQLSALDFGSPQAVTTINRWVSDNTGGKIPNIVDQINPEVVGYLINAIYFKGAWRERFDPRRTVQAPFHGADGSARDVPLMQRSGSIWHAFTPRAQVAELVYGNGAFALTVILPHPNVSVEELAAELTPARWDSLTASLARRQVELHLPRFTLAWERTLNDDLRALGMADAFDESRADFSRMSTTHELYISKVKQKTAVEVNEEGTEAAAVTSTEMSTVSLPPTMRVDRPFIVALRERLSGTVLFVGKVTALPQAR